MYQAFDLQLYYIRTYFKKYRKYHKRNYIIYNLLYFLDIDECANTSMNTCDINTTICTNIPGDYKCKCLSGLKHIDANPKSSCEGKVSVFPRT